MANNKDFKVKNGIQPTVYNEGVGTVVSGSENYSLAGASYDSVSFSVATEEASPSDISFKSDGTKMYIIGASGDDINQYTLSTAWDLSTSSFDSVTFSVATQELAPNALFIKPDGTTFWVAGNGNDTIYQYSMSTAWDMSTASYDSVSFSVATEGTYPVGIWFKTDGTEMFVADVAGVEVNQYTLSTAWDITTASFTTNLSVSSEDTGPNSVVFNSSGTSMFVSGTTNDAVYEYTLTTAWDLSTASYSGNSLSVSAQADYPSGIYFKSDGTKMYVVDYGTTDTIYQYSTVQITASLDLSTGSVFEITPTSDVQVTLSNPAASGTVSSATLLLNQEGTSGYDIASASYDSKSLSVTSEATLPIGSAIKSDGTSYYVIDNTGDTVYQYDLSTAWDISTASYASKSVSVASQTTSPVALAMSADGTKMYTGETGTVYQYTLSTAWDMSTASYASKSYTNGTNHTNLRGIVFKPDGTKVYIGDIGGTPKDVFQYSLSTAWDISTASYDSKTIDVASTVSSFGEFDFNTDGTKVFFQSSSNNAIYQYSLSTAWDISTATYDSISFSVSTEDATGRGFIFGDSGKKFYLVGDGNDTIFQYTSATSATITYDTALEFAGGTAPTSPAIGETDVITISTRDGGTTYQAIQAIDGAV